MHISLVFYSSFNILILSCCLLDSSLSSPVAHWITEPLLWDSIVFLIICGMLLLNSALSSFVSLECVFSVVISNMATFTSSVYIYDPSFLLFWTRMVPMFRHQEIRVLDYAL